MRNIKKDIIKDIKVLMDNSKTIKEFAKERYINENGEAVVDVYINNIDDLYSPYSDPKNREINNSVYEYIEDQANFIPVEYPIVVNFHSKEKLDENKIQDIIQHHYYKQIIDKKDDLKRNAWTSTTLFLIGLVLMMVYLTCRLVPDTYQFFYEVFSIIASFIIWEAADYAIINRSALRINYFNTAQLALIKIKTVKE